MQSYQYPHALNFQYQPEALKHRPNRQPKRHNSGLSAVEQWVERSRTVILSPFYGVLLLIYPNCLSTNHQFGIDVQFLKSSISICESDLIFVNLGYPHKKSIHKISLRTSLTQLLAVLIVVLDSFNNPTQ